MTLVQRLFSGEADLRAMAALVTDFSAGNLHVADLPYRLSSWAFDDPGDVGLWANTQGDLLAWAVLQAPFWTIDYACRRDAGQDLHRRLLVWAGSRAKQIAGTERGRPAWFVNVLAGETDRIRDLEEAGFACQSDVGEDSWSKVLMERPAVPEPAGDALPEGWTIRPLAGEVEIQAYVELHRAAFATRNMTAEWRARTLRRPKYVPDLDLVAVDPERCLAAFCIGWLSTTAGGEIDGQIEPLGVREDCRHAGLGRAILSESLRRLHRHRAGRIWVETDNHRNAALGLYESVGFKVIKDVLVYRRDFEKGDG